MSAEGSNAGGRRRGRRPHGQTILRGRYDVAERLVETVAADGRRIGLADTDRLVGAIRGSILLCVGGGWESNQQTEDGRVRSEHHDSSRQF